MFALALLLAFTAAPADTVFVDAPEIFGTWVFATARPGPNGATPPTQFPSRVTYGADGVARTTNLWDGTTTETGYRVADIDGRRVLFTDEPWNWQGTAFRLEGEALVMMHPSRISPPGPGGIIRCGTPHASAFDAVWQRAR